MPVEVHTPPHVGVFGAVHPLLFVTEYLSIEIYALHQFAVMGSPNNP